jgi:hypothetical protein
MVLHSAVSREPSSHPTYNCTFGFAVLPPERRLHPVVFHVLNSLLGRKLSHSRFLCEVSMLCDKKFHCTNRIQIKCLHINL